MKKYITALCISFFALTLQAQNATMWLTNGKKVEIQSYRLMDSAYQDPVIEYYNLKGKAKLKNTYDIFSITDAQKNEKVFYTKDLEIGNDFEIEQMREFLEGKSDARITYNGQWFLIGGIAAGSAAVFIPSLTTASATIPVGQILLPVGYIIVGGNTTKSFKQIEKQIPEHKNDDFYKMGYQKGVQEKRLRNTLIGTSIGVVAGLATFYSLK